ncbi:MAG: metal-dependent hydrolase [Sedimenticola sp.]|nr:metal-dependent hydrolase [Sedimenticola sp.]
MDSVTQIALGAAVGHAVLGHRVGYRAALWGAVCGTLPDLDVFISMGGPVADFTYHRSFSHSLIVLTLITPIITWFILKIHPATVEQRKGWLGLVFLALTTHPLLDSFTIYGTQLLWPFLETPVGLGSIFIIDPLYTLPLLIGVITALSLKRKPLLAQRFNRAGLLISTLYLGWSLTAQYGVKRLAEESLAHTQSPTSSLLVTPAPFNTLLWRVVAMDDSGYHEGYYSLLDQSSTISFTHYPSENALLDNLQQHWPVKRLTWFTKGFYKVEDLEGAITMTDLRMGAEPDYVFRFKVGTLSNPHPKPAVDERIHMPRNWERVPDMIRRIWTEPSK